MPSRLGYGLYKKNDRLKNISRYIYSREMPNNGHIGSRPFVLYMEVVPSQKRRQFT